MRRWKAVARWGAGALLALALCLAACSREEAMVPSPFAEASGIERQMEPYLPADGGLVAGAGLMSEDLCVVPLTYEQERGEGMTAASSLLFDVTDRDVLYADHVYDRLYPASITKILTFLVAIEECEDLSETVTVSYEASHITEWGAKKCGFEEGDQISLHDLLYSFLIYSGNDAGIAIAEHVAGSVEDFARLMNEKAMSLGAVNSHFVNPHGLHSDDHYTTAYDIYLIFNACLKEELFVDIISRDSFEAHYLSADGEERTATFETTNRYLLGKEEAPEGTTVIGGKTGTTMKAGSCLVLYSKDEEGKDYVSVVMKAETGDDLFRQMTELLDLEGSEGTIPEGGED